jgi:hypothetical protein
MKSLLRESWCIKLLNIACIQVDFPSHVSLYGSSRTFTQSGLSIFQHNLFPTYIADKTWVFYVDDVSKFFFHCVFKGQREIGDHMIERGQILNIVPNFPPTIIEAKCPLPPGLSLYLRGVGPRLSWDELIPMRRMGHSWKAHFRTPLQAYKFLIDNEHWEIGNDHKIGQLGFGCTHVRVPRFSKIATAHPLTIFQARTALPEGHSLYLHITGPRAETIPMVPINPETWEARLKPSRNREHAQYRISIDNRCKEQDDPHLIRQGRTNVCVPRFDGQFDAPPLPPPTAVQADYSVPPGHALYMRTEHETYPMVQINAKKWEARIVHPTAVSIWLDNIIAAEGPPQIPVASNINVFIPRFAFEKVLKPST